MSFELTQKIKAYALGEAGFDLVGVSGVELSAVHALALQRWIDRGFAGSMEYMKREPQKRSNPKLILPSAKSVISLAVNYYHPEDPKPENQAAGKVAQYAYGRDYHKVIQKKLKHLSKYIQELAGPQTEIKSYVDTGPILEKAFAQSAGLGFVGKNTNVITRNFGSWVFLASLVTNLDLESDAPHTGSCGSCRICIDACPTSALLGDYQMDATRCISYWTIEAKEAAPPGIQKQMGEWAFGCDICQTVCPYNFRAKTTAHGELFPKKIAGSWIGVDAAALKSEDNFNQTYQGSPIRRPKIEGLKRNVKIVAQNAGMV